MEQFPEKVIDSNKIFRRLNGYWNGLWRSTRGNPNTKSVELTLLGPILPYLAVSHFDPASNRFTFSFVGETVRDRFGVGIDKSFLDESPSKEIRDDLQSHLRTVVQARQPIIMAADMNNPNVPFRHYECFTLPLDGDGNTTTLITGITYAPCKHTGMQAA